MRIGVVYYIHIHNTAAPIFFMSDLSVSILHIND